MSPLKTQDPIYFKILLSDLKMTTRASEGSAGKIAVTSPTIPKGIKAEINLLSKGTGMGGQAYREQP